MREPTSFTKTAINKMKRDEIVDWAESHYLLEHLDRSDIAGMTKGRLVHEVMGALLRAEVDEEFRAAATDSQSRSLWELI